jgi:hypothetical protein
LFSVLLFGFRFNSGCAEFFRRKLAIPIRVVAVREREKEEIEKERDGKKNRENGKFSKKNFLNL